MKKSESALEGDAMIKATEEVKKSESVFEGQVKNSESILEEDASSTQNYEWSIGRSKSTCWLHVKKSTLPLKGYDKIKVMSQYIFQRRNKMHLEP